MNKSFSKIIIAGIFVFIYVILINIISAIVSADISITGNSILDYQTSGDVVVGIGDSVEVTVVRKRIYGSIIEESGRNTKSSTLYLFNLISLPLRTNGKNLFLAHLILITALSFSYYKTLKWKMKKDFERGFI